MKKYSYTTLLLLSILLCAAAWHFRIIQKDGTQLVLRLPLLTYSDLSSRQTHDLPKTDTHISESVPAYSEASGANPSSGSGSSKLPSGSDFVSSSSAPDFSKPELPDSTKPSAIEPSDPASQNSTSASEPPSSQAAEPSVPQVTEPVTTAPDPVMHTADSSYFDDALFIGDSRTVGLCEYGNLGGAEVIADNGMSVHKIFNMKFTTRAKRKESLEQVLSGRRFNKVYIMLGINELGYDFDYTFAKYVELINYIRQTQPNAIIFLEANLHVTDDRAGLPPYCNNESINRFNDAIKQLADGNRMFYLDVNELFDDENGNLSKKYTTDNAHVLGKYYADWVDWLLKHAVSI